VKGPTFARTIYPAPNLRPYTDIDVLAAPEATDALSDLLISIGFRAVEESHGGTEVKWVHRDNTFVMVEVHTDLVHAPTLRHSVRLRYCDIADAPESPATLLLVAIIHGGPGHQYERLQQLVDVVQAARAFDLVGEHGRFESLMQRTGARLAAIAGLELAGRVFQEPKCLEIARSLGHGRGRSLAKALMTRATVTSTMSQRRFWYSWRRQAFRELLKRSSRVS
jgi:putative nucleotidyltransferase-like protein